MTWPNVTSRSGGRWPPEVSGGGAEAWRTLAGLAPVLVDTGGMLDGASAWDAATGTWTVVFSAATGTVDGYREAIAELPFTLAELGLSDLDPTTDVIDLGLDLVSFPRSALSEAGLTAGIFDSETRASRNGACAAVRIATAGTDQVARMNATLTTGPNNMGLLSGYQATIQWGDTGSGYLPQMATLGLIEGTSRWDDGWALAGEAMSGPVSGWRVGFGAFRGSTDSSSGVTFVVRPLVRRRRTLRPFP